MLGVIEFLAPAIACGHGGIAVRATGGGIYILCRFSAECLEDVNPALRSRSALERFEASKDRLLSIAHKKISAGQISSSTVWIYTSDL